VTAVPPKALSPQRRYLAGLTSYDMRRDPHDHILDRALPADPGEAHAVVVWRGSRVPKQPQFLDSWMAEYALCGRRIKVLLPLTFRPDDSDADQCPRCRALVRSGALTPGRRPEVDHDATDATGVHPTSGHPWTGRQWTFGAVDEPEPERDDESA
jgi:hypothetical protein